MHDLFDLYAAAALQGLAARSEAPDYPTPSGRKKMAARAFEIAGDMLDAREAAFEKRRAIQSRAAK